MPIRMEYRSHKFADPIDVDVYHFHLREEELDCYVTCWAVEESYWLIVPLYTLNPKNSNKEKRMLNEYM